MFEVLCWDFDTEVYMEDEACNGKFDTLADAETYAYGLSRHYLGFYDEAIVYEFNEDGDAEPVCGYSENGCRFEL